MKATLVLSACAALAAAVPASAQQAAAASAQVDAWAGAIDHVWSVASKIVVDVRGAMKSQAPTITSDIRPFPIELPENCRPDANFDSDELPKVVFTFGSDQSVSYQLAWSGVECEAPKKFKKLGPQEWYFLKSARLIPIRTTVMSGYDLSIRVTAGEIKSKRLAARTDFGKDAPPTTIYMAGSFDLEVESKNLNQTHRETTVINFDALGNCTFSGDTSVLKVTSGDCDVDRGLNRVTTKAKTVGSSR